MEDHFTQKSTGCSKRPLNINESCSSSYYSKRTRLFFEQKTINHDRSSSSLRRKLLNPSSCDSLNSYFKQSNLTDEDFFELRQALQTICSYLQSDIIANQKQRLASPYYRQKNSHNSHLLLPLYTNEYFIRNGLLNHNDGPEIYDHLLGSKYFCPSHSSTVLTDLKSYSSSSIIVRSPLELLSNRKHFFTALTSNFALEKSNDSTSNMDLKVYQCHENQSETKSMLLRRNKVQIWERENILQEKMSATTLSTQKIDQLDCCCCIQHISPTDNQQVENKKLSQISNLEELFPMVKTLAPYIIIPDSSHLQIINKKPVQYVHHSSDIIALPVMAPRYQPPLLLPPTMAISGTYSDHNNNNNKEYRQTRSYLLSEFESVLTQLSRK